MEKNRGISELIFEIYFRSALDRGRPRVTELIAGDSVPLYEKVITSGKQYRSQRSISDAAYAIVAANVLLEAASDIQGLTLYALKFIYAIAGVTY